MSTLDIVLIAYAFVGCVYWLWLLAGALRLVRRVPVLADLDVAEPQAWPKLSIIVPACNEADSLEDAAATLLKLDYPELELVLIDDRSTDATGALVDRIAAADSRVRPLHIRELPDGWLGKVHALDCGVQPARGDWLLFTDADVHMAPDTLRRAVACAEHCRFDHLALVPDLWPAGFLLDAATASFLRVFCAAFRCWAVSDPDSSAYVGVGAFNLVRRRAFERTEGFRWLKMEVADDVGLGLMMKRSGARSALLGGKNLIGLYWYRSLAEAARGAEKGYASVANCRPARAVLLCLLITALELAPLATLLAIVPLNNPGLLWPALATTAAAVASAVVLRRWVDRPVLPALCFPVSALLAAAVMLRTAWLGWRRGGVLWRGTLYPSEQLRAGRRIRFGLGAAEKRQ